MKATITIDGMLRVEAETELEGYALSKWADENMTKRSAPDNLEVSWYSAEELKIRKKKNEAELG
jgi:hypothetical protein